MLPSMTRFSCLTSKSKTNFYLGLGPRRRALFTPGADEFLGPPHALGAQMRLRASRRAPPNPTRQVGGPGLVLQTCPPVTSLGRRPIAVYERTGEWGGRRLGSASYIQSSSATAPGNPGTAEHANGLRDSPAIVGGFQLRHDHRNTGELDDKIPKARR